MGSFQSAQLRYDNAAPDDDSAYRESLQAWVEDKAEQLVGGFDIAYRKSDGSSYGVTQDQYVEGVSKHLRALQEQEKDDLNALAILLLTAQAGQPVKNMIEDIVGPSAHSRGKLFEIAEAMLDPYAEAGLKADAEDAML